MRDTTEATATHRARSRGLGGVAHYFRDTLAGISAIRQLGAEVRSGTSDLTNPAQWLLDALGGSSKSGASVNEHTAFNVSAVRACVNLRANLLAMLPVKVYRKTSRGPEEQRDHPIARLFRTRVSPAHTRFKWVHASSVCEDLGGNAYTRVVRDTYFQVARLQWQKPSDVACLENPASGEIGYRINGVGDLRQYDVLHISGLSTNGRTGRSPISDLREAVGLSLTTEEFAARSFANGNRKPGFFVPPAGFTKAQADEFRALWQAQAAGAMNAGKQHVISGGMTWQDAGFSNQDAELLSMRKFSIEEIARVYQIPLHLIGSTEKATTWGSGIEQLNQGLVDYMLAPRCANWEAELNTTLLTEKELEQDYYIKFVVDALLRGSLETRVKIYQAMRAIAAMSVNEIREKEEMQLLPDSPFGDPRQPLNNQGGGGSPQQQPAPADQVPADTEE